MLIMTSIVSSLLSPSITLKMILLVFWQGIYLLMILVLRPFQRTQTNIDQISNEAVFFLLGSMLLYYNKESRWSSRIEHVYIWLLTSSSLVTFAIITGRPIIPQIALLFVYCIKKWAKSINSTNNKTVSSPQVDARAKERFIFVVAKFVSRKKS